MNVGVQFNSYDGMGGKLKTVYRLGDVKFNDDKKEGSIWCEKYFDLPEINVNFTLISFSMTEMNMSLKGRNKIGCGKVDCCFDQKGLCYHLALKEKERARLRAVHKDTPSYYKKEYGDIKDIDLAVEKILKEENKSSN